MKIEPTNLKGRADERAVFKLPPAQPWRFVAYDALPGGSVRLGTVTARTEEDARFKVYSYFEGGSFHPQGRHHPNPVRVWQASEELVIP